MFIVLCGKAICEKLGDKNVNMYHFHVKVSYINKSAWITLANGTSLRCYYFEYIYKNRMEKSEISSLYVLYSLTNNFTHK